MLYNQETTQKGVSTMQNLIIGTHKDNYYVTIAFLYKILGKADIVFSRADKIHETLNQFVDSNYKNIYIVAMRLKEDYIPEIVNNIKKMYEKKKEIKWYVLPDRVHIFDNTDKLFFESILKIPDKNETLIDAIKKDFKTDNCEYERLNKLYKHLEDREEKIKQTEDKKAKSKKQAEIISEEEKIFINFANYIEYVRYNYFRNAFEGMDLLKNLIEKIAYNSLTSEDLKISQSVDFYKKHISGESKIIKELQRQIARAGKDPDLSVVIYGETGTGKEVIAQMLHNESGRTGPFVPLNCAAIPDTLMESILFGYVKGAHSTAIEDRKGVFEEADGGTVFLDEIGDMPFYLQAKLLRVLEERVVRRIGGESKPKSVDFRLICATNKNLKQLIRENKFRQDLYYRIAQYEITIPPLRERKEDIEIIAMEILYDYYIKGKCGRIILNKKQIDALKSYDWSGGNIRELQSFLGKAIIDEDFDFEKRIQKYKLENIDNDMGKKEIKPLEEVEKEAIMNALKFCDFKKSETAKALKISLNTLKSKIKKYGI